MKLTPKNVGEYWITKSNKIVEIVFFDNDEYPVDGKYLKTEIVDCWTDQGTLWTETTDVDDFEKLITKEHDPELFI